MWCTKKGQPTWHQSFLQEHGQKHNPSCSGFPSLCCQEELVDSFPVQRKAFRSHTVISSWWSEPRIWFETLLEPRVYTGSLFSKILDFCIFFHIFMHRFCICAFYRTHFCWYIITFSDLLVTTYDFFSLIYFSYRIVLLIHLYISWFDLSTWVFFSICLYMLIWILRFHNATASTLYLIVDYVLLDAAVSWRLRKSSRSLKHRSCLFSCITFFIRWCVDFLSCCLWSRFSVKLGIERILKIDLIMVMSPIGLWDHTWTPLSALLHDINREITDFFLKVCFILFLCTKERIKKITGGSWFTHLFLFCNEKLKCFLLKKWMSFIICRLHVYMRPAPRIEKSICYLESLMQLRSII